MRKQFTRLQRLDHMFYAPEAPVLIAGGTLLREETSGNLLCQLKLRSLTEREIRCVQVAVQMLGEDGKALGKEIIHRYTELRLRQDEELGSKTAIVLPEPETKSFRARVTRVDFQDGRSWDGGSARWRKLPRQETLAEHFGDPELETQFQLRYGADCKYAMLEAGPLWFCVCGAANDSAEKKCRVCRRNRSAFRDLDPASLRRDSARRVEEERFYDEEEAEERRHRLRGFFRVLGVLVLLAAIAAAAWLLVPQLLAARRGEAPATAASLLRDTRRADYDAAQALLAKKDFDAAQAAFQALGDYEDSAELAESGVPYARAAYWMERAAYNHASELALIGKSEEDLDKTVSPAVLLYEAAAEEFRALGEYRDSAELAAVCEQNAQEQRESVKRAAYDDAAQLLEDKAYSLARAAFLELGEYEDSAEQAKEAAYRKAAGLYALLDTLPEGAVFADLTMEPEEESVFVLAGDAGRNLGSEAVAALGEACGKDRSNVIFEDEVEGRQSLREALAACFASLGEYKDSAALAAELEGEPSEQPAAAEPKAEGLEALFAAGDLAGAQEWLEQQGADYPDRELWLSRIKQYLPYCGKWTLQAGDPTVLPRTVGVNVNCYDFESKVIFEADKATIVLSGGEGEESFEVELTASYGDAMFLRLEEVYYYNVTVMANGLLSYVQLLNDGSYRSSCGYLPAA